ncbi:MAG: hypothetical protein IKC95_06970 [Oscillospiraceae bacterium]|nr:hypothetical protein [Oscillospiraceae bacterium]
MEIKALTKKIQPFLKKYKYVIIILTIGLVLMLMPDTKATSTNIQDYSSKAAEPSLEERLEKILSNVSGAGNVKVMLTIAEGEETFYQTNEDATSNNDAESFKTNTVTITDAQRNETGLIKQVNPAIYKGAIIVCQGGDNPVVQLAIVDAVSKITGLGANQISVLKMK